MRYKTIISFGGDDRYFFTVREILYLHKLEKIAFLCSLGVDPPKYNIDFEYGFIKRHYIYRQDPARLSETPSIEQWKFRALHITSNVIGATGQWGRYDFKDEEFEKIIDYEKNLAKGKVGKETVFSIVNKLKFKKENRNILQLCSKALSG